MKEIICSMTISNKQIHHSTLISTNINLNGTAMPYDNDLQTETSDGLNYSSAHIIRKIIKIYFHIPLLSTPYDIELGIFLQCYKYPAASIVKV